MQEFLTKFKKLLAVLILLLIAAYIPSYMKFNGMKDNLQNKFKEATSFGLVINGDVKIDILPLPQITLNNASVIDQEQYSYDVGKIVIRTSLASLFSGEFSPTKVKLSDATFEYNDIQEIITKSVSGAKDSGNIPALELHNINIIFSEDSSLQDIAGINGKLTYTGIAGQNLAFIGGFSINYLPYTINTTLAGFDETGNSEEATFEIANSFFKTNFSGKLESLFTSPKVMGKASLVFGNNVSTDSVSTFNLISLAYQDDLKVMADVELSDKEFNASNIVVSSNSITGAKGGVSYTYGDAQEFVADMTVDQFNIDQFVHVESSDKLHNLSAIAVLEGLIRPIINNFNFNISKSSTGSLKFNVKQMNFKKEEIKNLNFDVNIGDNQMMVNDFSVSMPGEGSVKILGSVTHNQIRPRFYGNLEFNVKQFDQFRKWLNFEVSEDLIKNAPSMSFKSEISLIPRNIKFEKIQANLGDSMMVGRISVKNTGEKRLNTKLSLRFNKVNADDFKLNEGVDNFITALFFYDADKSGKLLADYTNDFRWLRVYPVDLNGEVLIDKLIYKGTEIQSIQSAFRVEPNSLKFDRFIISDSKLNMDSTVSLNLTAFKPKLDIKTVVSKINVDFISGLFPSVEILKAKLIDAIEKSKEIKESITAASKEAAVEATNIRQKKGDKEEKEVVDKKVEKPITDRFNTFSVHSFTGKFDIFVGGITGTDIPITAIKTNGLIGDNVLKFESLSASIFGGKLDSTGSVVLATAVPAVSFSFALNNFNPELLLNHYFKLPKISGYMSISGTVAGNGMNENELLTRIYGDVKVVGKKVRWNGFDLASIIKTVEYKMPYNQKLENLRISIANGDTEFEDVTGTIKYSNGIATVQEFDLINNRARGRYSANVDFVNGLVNSISKISFIPVGFSAIPLTIELSSNGQLELQTTNVNLESINKFLQNQSGDYDRYVKEEEQKKNDSLIRNRRL